jgi:hypothetical protein
VSPAVYPLIHVNVTYPLLLTLGSAAPEVAPVTFQFRNRDED